jgi:secondary thiamine-phosphate synthase enzyme
MREAMPLAKVATRSVAPITRHSVIVSDVILKITSEEPIEFVDLTDHINQHLKRHAIQCGAVTVFSRHTTAAIKINEAEELLLKDFKQMLRRLCPVGHDYHHNDMRRRKPPIAPDERPNGHSHCMHLLLSTSETVPVIDSRLALGTWQRIFMVELDGPREREVIVRCHNYAAHEVTLAAKPNGLRGHVNGTSRAAGYRNGGLD